MVYPPFTHIPVLRRNGRQNKLALTISEANTTLKQSNELVLLKVSWLLHEDLHHIAGGVPENTRLIGPIDPCSLHVAM